MIHVIADGGVIVELRKGTLIQYRSLIHHGGNTMGMILSPPSLQLGITTMHVWNISKGFVERVDLQELIQVRWF